MVTKQTNELSPIYPILSKQCPKNGFMIGLTTLLYSDCSETMEAGTKICTHLTCRKAQKKGPQDEQIPLNPGLFWGATNHPGSRLFLLHLRGLRSKFVVRRTIPWLVTSQLREWSELMLIPLPYRPNTRYNPTLKSPTPGRTHTSPTSKGYFKYGSLKWHRLKPCHTPKMVSSKPIWCDPFARGWNIKE